MDAGSLDRNEKIKKVSGLWTNFFIKINDQYSL